ncbi:SapB/AmfS family lanthipeptide [Streptomyces sp. NPDC046261]
MVLLDLQIMETAGGHEDPMAFSGDGSGLSLLLCDEEPP